MNKIRNIVVLLLIILVVSFPLLVKAQPFDDDVLDNPVPFDGGVTLLMALGIGYGLKKVNDKKKAGKQ